MATCRTRRERRARSPKTAARRSRPPVTPVSALVARRRLRWHHRRRSLRNPARRVIKKPASEACDRSRRKRGVEEGAQDEPMERSAADSIISGRSGPAAGAGSSAELITPGLSRPLGSDALISPAPSLAMQPAQPAPGEHLRAVAIDQRGSDGERRQSGRPVPVQWAAPPGTAERGSHCGDKLTWPSGGEPSQAQAVNLNELTISKARQHYDYICIDCQREISSELGAETRDRIACSKSDPRLQRLMATAAPVRGPLKAANQRVHSRPPLFWLSSPKTHYGVVARCRPHYVRQRARHYHARPAQGGSIHPARAKLITARRGPRPRAQLGTRLGLVLLAVVALATVRAPSITGGQAARWDVSMQQGRAPLWLRRGEGHEDKKGASAKGRELAWSNNERDHNRRDDRRAKTAAAGHWPSSEGSGANRRPHRSAGRTRGARWTLDDNNDNRRAVRSRQSANNSLVQVPFDKISEGCRWPEEGAEGEEFLGPSSGRSQKTGKASANDDGCTSAASRYIKTSVGGLQSPRSIRLDRRSRDPPAGRMSAASAGHKADTGAGHSGHDRIGRSSGALRGREVAALVAGPQQAAQCPRPCQCLWRNGKQSADCSAHSLSSIPSGLDPLLQMLNLSASHLAELPRAAFSSLGLNNLQRIYLASCQMESVHADAFERLKSVVELDFSWNQLSFVPVSQMRHLSLLRKLVMRGNPLLALNERTLSGGSAGLIGGEADVKGRGSNSAANMVNLASNMSRLFEAFPELVRALVHQRGASTAGDDNLIIRNSRLPQRAGASPPSASSSGPTETNEQEMLGLLQRLVQLEREHDDELASADADEPPALEDPLDQEQAEEWAWRGRAAGSLGAHFAHMQELDFGQCRLSYIKWNTFQHLHQLKRLLLDGNQLSQLSGRLVGAMPAGLHQLGLEENPWRCDCRLAALKRWLLSTRTPLRAPVRCLSGGPAEVPQRPQASRRRLLTAEPPLGAVLVLDDRYEPEERPAQLDGKLNGELADLSSGGPKLHRTQQQQYSARQEAQPLLDKLTLDDFVCAPQVNLARTNFALPKREVPTIGNDGAAKLNLDQPTAEAPASPSLSALYEYLAPTLPDWRLQARVPALSSRPHPATPLSSPPSHPQARAPLRLEPALAVEDERVTLNCSFLAYPAESLDVIWLVDYNQRHAQVEVEQRPNSSRLPVEERFVVLYDSKLHRLNANQAPANSSEEHVVFASGSHVSEVSLYGARLIIRETRQASLESADSALKESQVVIQAAHVDDSARYKCIAVNSAGNASVEHLLKVSRAANAPSRVPATRDQRAQTAAKTQEEAPRSLAAQGSQVTVGGAGPASSSWLKSSTAFQISMVVVSVLMGAVIVAFLLFCIVIYQIKPSDGLTLPANASAAGKMSTFALDNGADVDPATLAHSVAVVNGRAGFNNNDNKNYTSTLLANHQTVGGANGPLAAIYTGGRLIMPPASGAGACSPSSSTAGAAHEQPAFVGNQTPLLTAVCDPLTGQSPVHLLLHPTTHVQPPRLPPQSAGNNRQRMSQAANTSQQQRYEESALTWLRQPTDYEWAQYNGGQQHSANAGF